MKTHVLCSRASNANLAERPGALCWKGCSLLRVNAAMVFSLVRKKPSPSAALLMAFRGLAYYSDASNGLICSFACGCWVLFSGRSPGTRVCTLSNLLAQQRQGSPGLRITRTDCRNIMKSSSTRLHRKCLSYHTPFRTRLDQPHDLWRQVSTVLPEGNGPFCSGLCSAVWL